jgi:hypothetical protein
MIPKTSFLTKFIILTFACFRLAQFLPNDTGPFSIFQRIRDWSFNKRKTHGPKNEYDIWDSIHELVNCPFCQGIWIASILALMLKPKNIAQYFVYLFAIAGGQTYLETKNSDPRRD